MQQSDAIRLTLEAVWLMFQLSAPAIVVASIAGLLVAVVQAITQVQEQTIQFAVKFVAIVVTVFLTASFLASGLVTYGDRLFSDFPALVRR